nr:unnamed protein product [Callosobruchus analis]
MVKAISNTNSHRCTRLHSCPNWKTIRFW